MSLHAKIRMEIPPTVWSQHLWRGGGGRMAARTGQVRAGPASGRDWAAAPPPSLARTGQGTRVRAHVLPSSLPSMPLLCLPHSLRGLGPLLSAHLLRVYRLDLSGTFLGNLFPGCFCLQKGRHRWEWKYMLPNWTSVSASVQARPGNGTLLEAPGHHLATWGGNSALGVMKPPPVATKAHMKPQKHRGGGF